jgi:hypothetical protein
MLKNAKTEPKVYYGLHMVEGVCEYTDMVSGKPYRVLVRDETIRNMGATFPGKPLYVKHVDQVDLDKIQDADGFVIESFFNKSDGKHWAKFIVVSDAGHEAIAKKWKLSNAYKPKSFAAGGRWQNVEYLKEIVEGVFDHLAIVPDPRYEESIILTPEEFKLYNSQKEIELQKLANSKETVSMFKFLKKQTLDNSASSELESTSITLTSGKELTIAQLANGYEEMVKEKKDNEAAAAQIAAQPKLANGDDMVKVGEEQMTVNQLVEKYQASVGGVKAAPVPAEAQKNAEDKAKEEAAAADAKKNADEAAEKAKKEESEKAEKMKNSQHFETLKNAAAAAEAAKSATVETSMDQVARGKARYGSGS